MISFAVLDINYGGRKMMICNQTIFDISFEFVHSKAQNLCKMLPSSSHNAICNITKMKTFTYC